MNYKHIGDNKAEIILEIINDVLLFVNVLATIIVAIIFFCSKTPYLGIIVLVGGSFVTAVTWAVLLLFINISNNIRQIKYHINNLNNSNK